MCYKEETTDETVAHSSAVGGGSCMRGGIDGADGAGEARRDALHLRFAARWERTPHGIAGRGESDGIRLAGE